MITLDRQIECVRREIKLRRKIYPNRVLTGRMTAGKAHEELTAMEAVLERLEHEQVRERLL
jgi:hypothetical protein